MNNITLHGGDLGGLVVELDASVGDIITVEGLAYRVEENLIAIYIGLA